MPCRCLAHQNSSVRKKSIDGHDICSVLLTITEIAGWETSSSAFSRRLSFRSIDSSINCDAVKIPANFINSTLMALTISLSAGMYSMYVSYRGEDGARYYVATTGSDSNSGTASSPWRTIQRAANSLQAG